MPAISPDGATQPGHGLCVFTARCARDRKARKGRKNQDLVLGFERMPGRDSGPLALYPGRGLG